MMYWGNGMSTWGILFMILGNLLFWGLIIVGVVMLVRSAGRSQAPPSVGHGPSPQQLLAERFARGEIDEDEYTRRLRVLDASAPGRKTGK